MRCWWIVLLFATPGVSFSAGESSKCLYAQEMLTTYEFEFEMGVTRRDSLRLALGACQDVFDKWGRTPEAVDEKKWDAAIKSGELSNEEMLRWGNCTNTFEEWSPVADATFAMARKAEDARVVVKKFCQ